MLTARDIVVVGAQRGLNVFRRDHGPEPQVISTSVLHTAPVLELANFMIAPRLICPTMVNGAEIEYSETLLYEATKDFKLPDLLPSPARSLPYPSEIPLQLHVLLGNLPASAREKQLAQVVALAQLKVPGQATRDNHALHRKTTRFRWHK